MTEFRIHPSIGIARVGNSPEYYLAPDTRAAIEADGDGNVAGGLPIKAAGVGHITSLDLRDRDGALKRQAARFRVFAYEDLPDGSTEAYPRGGGREVHIGSKVGDRTVADIIWQVHVANKKANTYANEWPASGETAIIANFESGLPPLRNAALGDPTDPERVRMLTIDPGPRTIQGPSADPIELDADSPASYLGDGQIHPLPDYPTSFPSDSFTPLFSPTGDIETLGQLETDRDGRLIVVAGYGRASAWIDPETGEPYPLDEFVDNDGWFDDTADGPVSAALVFDDGSTAPIAGAWVVSTDPAYAPQTINAVTLWDDIFDSWIRKLGLMPEVFDVGYQRDFRPSFADHLHPFFRAAALQGFNAYLPSIALDAHEAVGAIGPDDDPIDTILGGLAFIRNPNDPGEGVVGVPLMPLSLGDSGQAWLSPSFTQYFFLEQWNAGRFDERAPVELGPGERLDRASLFNCLGGRFSPGIDMTFIVRQPEVWEQDWQTSGGGPFRLRPAELRYWEATSSEPFLTEGYVPIHRNGDGLEPGDTSKFMAIPWHTDYNACATHTTQPNPANSTTLFWSWPAQRPVTVYVAADAEGSDTLPPQRYSVRGAGTAAPNPGNRGKYQHALDMVANWPKIGTVMQGTAIAPEDGGPFPEDWFLEVASQLEPEAGEPQPDPWPINATTASF